MPHEPARQSQAENIQRQLSRLGNTVYEAALVTMGEGTAEVFIPSSRLADLRRQTIAALDDAIATSSPVCGDAIATIATTTTVTPPAYPYPYLYNVANVTAREVYARQGVDGVGEAFELSGTPDGKPVLLMRCRHCLRRTLGCCTRDGHQPPQWHEPLFLVLPDKRRFRLQFNCRDCEMLVFST